MNRDRTERPLQRFSDEYLERCRELSPADIVRFLEDFRVSVGSASRKFQPFYRVTSSSAADSHTKVSPGHQRDDL